MPWLNEEIAGRNTFNIWLRKARSVCRDVETVISPIIYETVVLSQGQIRMLATRLPYSLQIVSKVERHTTVIRVLKDSDISYLNSLLLKSSVGVSNCGLFGWSHFSKSPTALVLLWHIQMHKLIRYFAKEVNLFIC
jgi:hypothetical protein